MEPSPIRPHLSPARFSEHASTSGYLRQPNWTHGTLSVWGTATRSDIEMVYGDEELIDEDGQPKPGYEGK